MTIGETIRRLRAANKLTQEELSTRLGRSRTAIANTMRLLDLPDDLSEKVASGELSEGHGRALLGLRDRSKLSETAKAVAERELSVRQTEELVRRLNESFGKTKSDESGASVRDVDYIAELEKRIRNSIGRSVRIVEGRKTKKIEIEYTDNADLDALLRQLCGVDFFNE